ncbi:hypothetical protein OW492_00510 [Psychromonas sp. 14N.309.X.WAT.B.A12]|uniref:hypothetical protein n=1 Tax=Psychromonas sp. 14N.309.X.WAT.B.A12 TaxID=2998322 RepID=UPI0025AF1E72|nr:hypothetical protein [Psychromonas sp. 14N.309.X.WAT.B.A12]MDN2661853.1 hypothetical protein [Psychromonas sp. 14N.309.X.WAT.B.A12]
MTIYQDDIKLLESQNMTDESDGGGAMTNVEIVSGEHNSIFPDISDLDRAYGSVNIRSIHLKVDSDTDETYYGSTIGLSEMPEDEDVSITLMSVNDPYATRSESQNIIESYLTKSAKYSGELYGMQLLGQRAIRIIQRSSVAVPSVGDVLALFNPDNDDEQYVKIKSVESGEQDFTYSNGSSGIDFSRLVVICEITEPLKFEFIGVAASPYDPTSNYSAIYDTAVADAASFYSTKKLEEDAAFGASALQVDSIYTQLVPSTTVQTAHVNQSVVGNKDVTLDAGNGELVDIPITIETQQIDITLNNQGYVYTQTLVPVPDAGTLTISYMVQGSWYELTDNGDGTLTGASASYGTAQYDELGNLSMTLGALPDVGSIILMQYAQASSYLKFIDDVNYTREIEFEFESYVNYRDCTITWGEDDEFTATSIDGVISGDATGEMGLNYCIIIPTITPASDTEFYFEWESYSSPLTSYEQNQIYDEIVSIESVNDQVKVSLPANISELNVSLEFSVSSAATEVVSGTELYIPRDVKVYDDGQGALFLAASSNSSQPQVGMIDYVSGEVLIDEVFEVDFTKRVMTAYTYSYGSDAHGGSKVIYKQSGVETSKQNTVSIGDVNKRFSVKYNEQSSVNEASSVFGGNLTKSMPVFEAVIENYNQTIIDNSFSFYFNDRLIKENSGILLDISTPVGTLDKETGQLTLDSWPQGNGELSINSGLVYNGVAPLTQSVTFLTAGNPVVSQSLSVNAKDFTGKTINAVTDESGVISGDNFEGYIDIDLGIVTVLSDELLDTASIYYNCVSYSYLALSSDILGLDTIKLPSDGKVPIYRSGDVCVVHQDESLEIEVTENETLQLPHVRLVELSATGVEYSVDLDAGLVTFLESGTAEIDYRFEDIFLVAGVDISGVIKTARPLSHAYDADKAKVASVLVADDLFSRYTNFFDQKTWTGDFSESLIGDEATVAYNDTLYPIEVTNDGCITERMAIVFTTSTAFKLIGENIGQIAVGDINTTFAPINPVSGKPYFTLNHLGWGAGWSAGNVVRFDTYGAVYQLNLIRTILQSDSTTAAKSDQFAIQVRGNINNDI